MRLKPVLASFSLSLMLTMGIWIPPTFAELEQSIQSIPENPMGLLAIQTEAKAWEDLIKNKPFSDLWKEWIEDGLEIKDFEKESGLNFEKDVVPLLGTHVVTAFYEGAPNAEFPDVLVSFDLGDKSKFEVILNALKKDPEAKDKLTEFKHKNWTLYALDTDDEKTKEDTPKQSQSHSIVYMLATDKIMLISNNQKLLKQAVDLTGAKGSVLNEPKFKPVYQALKKEKIFFYGDVHSLINNNFAKSQPENTPQKPSEESKDSENPDPEADPFSDFFNNIDTELASVIQGAFSMYDSFGFALDLNLKGLKISNTFVFKDKNLTDAQKKYLAKLTSKPLKSLEPLLDAVPSQPLMALFTQGLDLNWEEASAAVFDTKNTQNKKTHGELQHMMKAIKTGLIKAVGLDLQKDVLELSDGRAGLSAFYLERYPTYKTFPHVVAYLGIKDEAKFQQVVFNKFKITDTGMDEAFSALPEKMAGGEDSPQIKPSPSATPTISLFFDKEPRETYQGHPIHTMNLTSIPEFSQAEKEWGILPAVTHFKGVWLLGSSPTALKAVIDVANGQLPSLSQNPEFQRTRSGMSGLNGTNIGYFDLTRWYDMGSYLLRDDTDFKRAKPLLKAFRALAMDGNIQKESTTGHFVVDVDLPKLDFSKLAEGDASTTAQVRSVKANMYTLQTMLESYGVDWGGSYPKDLALLQKDASKRNYWKELTNPVTNKMGLALKTNQLQGAMMDYSTYKNFKPHPKFAGMALYEPLFNKQYSTKDFTSYRIYGCDEKGELLQDKDGKVFYLTNS